MNNENEINWYQVVAIIFVIAYAIGCIFTLSENNIDDISIILIYAIIGLISFFFMYGFGKIIQLLNSINNKIPNYVNYTSKTINENKKENVCSNNPSKESFTNTIAKDVMDVKIINNKIECPYCGKLNNPKKEYCFMCGKKTQ